MVTVGCRTSRKAAEVTDLSNAGRQLLENAIKSQPAFTGIDMKRITVNVTLGGNSFSSPASCRIIPDSAIYLSAQPFLGIEMGVARFTRDGFVVLDKIRKTAYVGNYDFLTEKFGLAINYAVIEALITNKLFVINFPDNSLKQLTPSVKDNDWQLTYNNASIRQVFRVGNDYRIRRAEISTPGGRQSFTAEYDNFSSQDLLLFPYQYKVSATTTSRKFSLSVAITRMVTNELPQIPEISTAGYRIGNIESLLKLK